MDWLQPKDTAEGRWQAYASRQLGASGFVHVGLFTDCLGVFQEQIF